MTESIFQSSMKYYFSYSLTVCSSLKYHFRCLLQVTDYEGNGFAVSFLKEKANGFYVNPETEEIASVLEEELVVLEPPTAVNKQRTFGFQFPDNISSILRDYFFSQGKAINY